MNFACQSPSATGIVWFGHGGCDAFVSDVGDTKGEPLIGSRLRPDALPQMIQCRAAAVFRDEPKQNESEIAVDRFRSRQIFELHPADVMLELASSKRRRIDQPRSEAGCVLQQIANGHVRAIRASPILEE